MITFDLRGKDVGPNIFRAIQRAAAEDAIALHCTHVKFLTAFDLAGAEIASADFAGAEFVHGIRLNNVTFTEDACFDDAVASDFWLQKTTFGGSALFRRLRAANLKVGGGSFERYASFDEARLGFGNFRDVRFAAEARFRESNSRGMLTFRSAHFAGATSFQNSAAQRLAFPVCAFQGPFQARGLKVEQALEFVGAHFADTRLLELNAGSEVIIRDSSFAQPLALVVESPSLQASGACFERGADVLLDADAGAAFDGASFLGPSSIGMRLADGKPAKLTSLDRARVERLSLERLDLSECSFARLHRLDGVLISGRGQLALSPPIVEGSYRREVLADEVLRRAIVPSKMLQWAPMRWRVPPALTEQDPLEAQTISDTYRAMRKAREKSHDHPGAADFYYGEMEMRRESSDSWIERAILTIYWIISGYGLRASRALATFALTVLLLAAAFQAFGLEHPANFWHTLGWTLTASVSLAKPVETMDLTAGGIYLNVLARIVGPALIALVVLALRSRVRR